MRMLSAAVFGLAVCGGSAALHHTTPAAPTAAAASATAPAIITGTVTSIDKDAKTFVLATEGDEEITISYDDKTVWVLNGEISTCEAVLKKDHELTVTHESSEAARVQSDPKKQPS